jgi:hypothetical protein
MCYYRKRKRHLSCYKSYCGQNGKNAIDIFDPLKSRRVDYFVLFSHLNGDLTTLTPTELQRRLINSFISKQQQRFLKTSQLINLTRRGMAPRSIILIVLSFLLLTQSESAPQAFKREPGHPQWHHSAFHDVRDTVRSDIRRMLHSRAEVIFLPSTQFRILI